MLGSLPGESAAAVARVAAVAVDDDLAAGEAGVALRPADHKAARGIDKELGVFIQQFRGHGRADDLFDHVALDLLVGGFGGVLRGKHHGLDAHGTVVVVFHGHLRLAVGPQIGDGPGLARLRQRAGQLVRQRDGQRHVFGGFVAGVAKHHALIARAHVLVAALDAHGDVRRLLVHGHQHRAGLAVEAVLGAVIADLDDLVAGDLVDGHVGGGGDLAHHQHHAGGSAAFAGHVSVGILGEYGVEHARRRSGRRSCRDGPR